MSFNTSKFQGVFSFQILYKRLEKLQAKVLNSICRAEAFQFYKLLQIANFDVL